MSWMRCLDPSPMLKTMPDMVGREWCLADPPIMPVMRGYETSCRVACRVDFSRGSMARQAASAGLTAATGGHRVIA